jgi:hypothetical protein
LFVTVAVVLLELEQVLERFAVAAASSHQEPRI